MRRARALIARGRRAAESIMDTIATVDRPGETVTDAAGVVTVDMTRIYPSTEELEAGNLGRCKLQQSPAQSAEPSGGQHRFVVESLTLQFPMSAALRANDVATITKSDLDPHLVGLKFRLVGLERGTYRTANRWNVEAVTA